MLDIEFLKARKPAMKKLAYHIRYFSSLISRHENLKQISPLYVRMIANVF